MDPMDCRTRIIFNNPPKLAEMLKYPNGNPNPTINKPYYRLITAEMEKGLVPNDPWKEGRGPPTSIEPIQPVLPSPIQPIPSFYEETQSSFASLHPPSLKFDSESITSLRETRNVYNQPRTVATDRVIVNILAAIIKIRAVSKFSNGTVWTMKDASEATIDVVVWDEAIGKRGRIGDVVYLSSIHLKQYNNVLQGNTMNNQSTLEITHRMNPQIGDKEVYKVDEMWESVVLQVRLVLAIVRRLQLDSAAAANMDLDDTTSVNLLEQWWDELDPNELHHEPVETDVEEEQEVKRGREHKITSIERKEQRELSPPIVPTLPRNTDIPNPLLSYPPPNGYRLAYLNIGSWDRFVKQGGFRWIDAENADIITLSHTALTKKKFDEDKNVEALRSRGYTVYHAHQTNIIGGLEAGTLVACRIPTKKVYIDASNDPSSQASLVAFPQFLQGRIITIEFDNVYILILSVFKSLINSQSDFSRLWRQTTSRYFKILNLTKPTIVVGADYVTGGRSDCYHYKKYEFKWFDSHMSTFWEDFVIGRRNYPILLWGLPPQTRYSVDAWLMSKFQHDPDKRGGHWTKYIPRATGPPRANLDLLNRELSHGLRTDSFIVSEELRTSINACEIRYGVYVQGQRTGRCPVIMEIACTKLESGGGKGKRKEIVN